MAHFAILRKDDENEFGKLVVQVIVVGNDILGSPEDESKGIEWLNNFGVFSPKEYDFRQTSYHGTFRKNFAGIGSRWNESLDGFIAPKPENTPVDEDKKSLKGEWILNEKTCNWEFKETT